MKSQQFEGYGQPLSERDYENPVPKGHEVLIEVSACGVCHSDVHIWEGYFDLGNGKKIEMKGGQKLPFTLGHEIAGVVAAVGADVESINIGDSCVVYPWIGCGSCDICARGDEHLCARPRALGAAVDGGYSDYVVVPHERYLFDHADIPASVACTYACSGVTSYNAINKIKEKAQGGELLIIGAGGVGLAALEISKVLLDCDIIVADIDPVKRELALEKGAQQVIDPLDSDAVKALFKRTSGGVSAVIDFVGSDKTAALGMGLLNKGGAMIVVGLFGGSFSISLPLLPLKNISISGSYVGSLQDMAELMALARSGKLAPLVVEELPMSCACEALNNLRDGNVVGRVVLIQD